MLDIRIPTIDNQFYDASAFALNASVTNPYAYTPSVFTSKSGSYMSLPSLIDTDILSFANNNNVLKPNIFAISPLPTPDYSAWFSKDSKVTSTISPFSFGNITNNNNIYNFSNFLFSTNQTALNEKTTYQTNTSSKIKPGLLKGNLKGKEAVITQLCEKYNVDVALVMTIIGQESGFGTSNLAQHNNFMGYRASGDAGKSDRGFGYFSTPEKGLEAAIKNLASYPQRYADKGVKKADLNNIDAIGRIYCEGNSYATAIKGLYNSTVKKYLV